MAEAPAPSVTLTDDEIRGIESLCSGSKELSGAMDTLKAALLEYKAQGYLNKVESEKITEQEMAFIEKTVKSLGLASDFTEKTVQDFINRLTTYKQNLMKG
jgi:chromosome condensin MukBEF complex kleisin-like MukF subunit